MNRPGCPLGGPRCPESICDCFIETHPDDPTGLHPEMFVVGPDQPEVEPSPHLPARPTPDRHEGGLMHSPEVIAHEIRRPWPKRQRSTPTGPRWQIRYEWAKWYDLRPGSFRAFWTLAGREFYWPALVTIWHMEPGGQDSLTVCKYTGRWRWHVHHWSIQIHPLQKVKRFLFERCELCGHRYPWGYAPTSHGWDQKPAPWFRVSRRAYHTECSALVSLRRMVKDDEAMLSGLVEEIATASGETRGAVVDRLTGPRGVGEFHVRHRLQSALGYERDDDYRLVTKGSRRDRRATTNGENR